MIPLAQRPLCDGMRLDACRILNPVCLFSCIGTIRPGLPLNPSLLRAGVLICPATALTLMHYASASA